MQSAVVRLHKTIAVFKVTTRKMKFDKTVIYFYRLFHSENVYFKNEMKIIKTLPIETVGPQSFDVGFGWVT